ncbi:MAG: amidohydrolase family protein [Chitinophagales bacterium]|nr:amidohydrolase family protein [Chitinophagales bacterium]MDW8428091.1 amidohydrolase family protein [Chitinophagales bacterium]
MRTLIGAVALWGMALKTSVLAQTTFPVHGVQDERQRHVALVNATIIPDAKTVLTSATLLIRQGRIVAVGTKVDIPSDATVIDATGYFIYPSFIELISDYGMPAQNTASRQDRLQLESAKKGAYYWNEAVRAEVKAHELFSQRADVAQQLRAMGFGSVVTHVRDGIVRGSGALVLLGEERDNDLMIRQQAAAFYSFNKGSSQQPYPTSLMGSIALLRQIFYDVNWYTAGGWREQQNISLDELQQNLKLPQVFETNDVLSVLSAARIAREFGFTFIIKGGGNEYQRIDELKEIGMPLIIPLTFPRPYRFQDPFDAATVPLSDLMHWEFAPANAAFLSQAGIPFAFTAAGMKEAKEFWKSLRGAAAAGLSSADLLKALTEMPARWMRIEDQLGTLAPGKLANFFVCTDSLLDPENTIVQHWIRGRMYPVASSELIDLRGRYTLEAGPLKATLVISGDFAAPQASIRLGDTATYTARLQRQERLVTLSFRQPQQGTLNWMLSGYLLGRDLTGHGTDAHGKPVNWHARYQGPPPKPKDTAVVWTHTVEGKLRRPFNGFGWEQLPKPETVLIRNATVWTNEAEGIMPKTDVLLQNGKIARIGKNLNVPDARIIDGTGKHLTAGIIDEHAHIAIRQGVNECSHSVTSEVRIGDVIDPNDVNIYRQLAGGVTASHLLHGSCNTIGGQTQLIKMRWGYGSEALKFKGWPGFIKFALGENVKTSNWGDQYRFRFPQTRMGVEQTIKDAFIRAKTYKKKWDEYNRLSAKQKALTVPPRRDLQLEALVEILEGRRHITCHSYVQSEINMLMRLAESLGFRVNTFTHILEGYKVADKMKAHGANASSFSDWWAYKFEVYEAIPHNPALLAQMGVVTAVNSDDAEMGRRLNQEAAKSVKYGGLSEEEAWKLCTLNPARMLRVDGQVGSIRVGKDADVVLWSDHPLSIYAKAEYTWVDGILFYSRQQAAQQQEWIQAERQRLMRKMMAAIASGEPAREPSTFSQTLWDCETITSGQDVE